MTEPFDRDRRFDDDDFAHIMRRAAELQERREGIEPRARGYTLTEIEQIAREVGISPAHVRSVVATMTRSGHGKGVLAMLAGGPYRFRFENTLKAELADADRGALVDVARAEFEKQGEVQEVLDTIEWKDRDDFGSVVVSVTRRDGATTMRAGADLQAAAGMLVGMLPVGGAFAGMVAASIVGVGPGADAAALIGGGAAAAYLIGRFAWTRASNRWEKRLSRLMTRLNRAAEERLERPHAADDSPAGSADAPPPPGEPDATTYAGPRPPTNRPTSRT